MLRSMYFERRYTTIICSDETGLRFEELPNVTMTPRGSRKVLVRSGGHEKTLFTVYLHGSMKLDEWGNVVSVKKEKPVILFKGATDGPVSRAIATAAGDRASIPPPRELQFI